METIEVTIIRDDVYEEVAKATDYTGSKLITDESDEVRERILMQDEDQASLGRFWDEAATACNEYLKEMLVSGVTRNVDVYRRSDGSYATEEERTETGMTRVVAPAYRATIEVSKSFDKNLRASVESALRSYFISSIIGQWFVFSNKEETQGYLQQSEEMMAGAERLLYSRKRPTRPTE